MIKPRDLVKLAAIVNDDNSTHIPDRAEKIVCSKISQSEPITYDHRRIILSLMRINLPGATNASDNQLMTWKMLYNIQEKDSLKGGKN